MAFKDKRNSDKPREKLAKYGAETLTDLELLMALIGSGNAQADVAKISREVLKLLKQFDGEIPYQNLQEVGGMGAAKTTEIIAAFELARRYILESDRPIIDSPEKAVELLADICEKKQEYFMCLTLDGANRLIAKRVITIGILTSSLVHPREVFADAITDRAASIIVAHNHPSGNIEPSIADVQITERLRNTGQLLGISLVDHIIISGQSHLSIIRYK